MNRFILTDASKCIGCHTCEVACTVSHEGNIVSWLPRLKLVKHQNVTTTIQCRHCEDAPCVKVCPTRALVHAENTVQLIPENCIGCKTCVIACPFGAMSMVTVPAHAPSFNGLEAKTTSTTAHKCDLCINQTTGPACAKACPTSAMQLVTAEMLEETTAEKQRRALAGLQKLL